MLVCIHQATAGNFPVSHPLTISLKTPLKKYNTNLYEYFRILLFFLYFEKTQTQSMVWMKTMKN